MTAHKGVSNMYMEIVPQWALDAAKELRIKIHMNGECPADHPDNKRWLDSVIGADALIILRHYKLSAMKHSQQQQNASHNERGSQ